MNTLKYLDFVRSMPCLICRKISVDAHHIVSVGMGNNRKKPSLRHLSAVSLCRAHHGELHTMKQREFEEKYSINLWKEAFSIYIEFSLGRAVPFHNDQWEDTK